MKLSIIIFIVIFRYSFCNAQGKENVTFKKNQIFFELFGNVVNVTSDFPYSINYERMIWRNKHGWLTGRIGVVYSNDRSSPLYEYVLRILINGVFFSKNHHLELGSGITLDSYFGNKKIVFNKYSFAVDFNIMYRFQRPNGRLIFRIGWTPMYYPNEIPAYSYTIANAGISLGYAF